jgi:hypothetical protein
VDASHIQVHQAARLSRAIARQLSYLIRLRSRMEQLGFRPDDHLYCLTCDAIESTHRLRVAAHYLSCESGVGASVPSRQGGGRAVGGRAPTRAGAHLNDQRVAVTMPAAKRR